MTSSPQKCGGDPTTLAGFLDRHAATAFAWGECDCALMVADWIHARHGVDPAAGWRGRYHSRPGCLRLLDAAGGLVAAFDAIAAAHGITRTETPVVGDVGVILVDIGGRPCRVAAIRAAFGWAMRIDGAGIAVVRAEPLAAWRI